MADRNAVKRRLGSHAYLGRSVWFAALVRWLSSPRSRTGIVAGSILTVVVVALADVATGPVISLALLYLLPVMATAWAGGRRIAIPLALGAGLAGLAAFLFDTGNAPVTVGVWNAAVRTVMFVTVAWLVDSQRHLLQEHYSASMIDGLTGVLTRRAFYTAGERTLRRAARHELPVSLLYADLDRLKHANDNYGHEAGDEMIAHFAHVASGLLDEHDLIARIGGDEFVILVPGVGAMGAVELAERLAIRLLEDGGGPAISASVGVSAHDRVNADLETMVREADDAMYEAKHAGGAAIRLRISLDLDDPEALIRDAEPRRGPRRRGTPGH